MTTYLPEYAYTLSEDDCKLDEFIELVGRTTDLRDCPYASSVEQNVLAYDSATLRTATVTPQGRIGVHAELAKALMDGPGIVVFKNAFPDTGVVDEASAVFPAVIAEQHAAGSAVGDHFAAAGDNGRIWNALEKLAVVPSPSSRTRGTKPAATTSGSRSTVPGTASPSGSRTDCRCGPSNPV